MSKINKLGKSTFVIAILSFVLVAVLAFGGTYAYFSASSKNAVTKEVTMGHLRIADGAWATEGTIIEESKFAVPNQTIINKDVEVGVTSNVNYFIRAIFSYNIKLSGTHAQTEQTPCADANEALLDIVLDSAWKGEGVDANAGKAVYTETTETDGSKTNTAYLYLTTAQEGAEAAQTETLNLNVKVRPEIGQVSSEHFMDAEITIKVTFQVIQADYIISGTDTPSTTEETAVATLKTAFNTAFGVQ